MTEYSIYAIFNFDKFSPIKGAVKKKPLQIGNRTTRNHVAGVTVAFDMCRYYGRGLVRESILEVVSEGRKEEGDYRDYRRMLKLMYCKIQVVAAI